MNKMKLAVFDFDSTLMDGETLEFLASEMGCQKEISEITSRAMLGEADFFESLRERVYRLKGLSEKKVNEICENLPVMTGAKETVQELKKLNYKVVCFSGGFRNATVPFAQKFGLDGEFSNVLHTKNEVLTGFLGGEMMFDNSKGIMLQKLQKLLNVELDCTMAIGDGANDLSMFKYAGIKVSFCGKPVLEEAADIKIKNKDLREILEYI